MLCIRVRLLVGPQEDERELGFSPCYGESCKKAQVLKPRFLLGLNGPTKVGP
jgi:hypothetical protein